MPPIKREVPYVWVTWLPKLLVGSHSCLWSVWFRSHFTGYAKTANTFDRVMWNIKHTAALDVAEKNYQQRFPIVRREHQNSFQCLGRSGAILAGKIDLIGVSDTELRICDVKTGERKDEHWVQMMLYMHFFPICFPHLYEGLNVVGELIYPGGKQEVYLEEYQTLKEQVTKLLAQVVSEDPPSSAASSTECRSCNITSEDCLERVEGAPESRQMALADF